MRPRMRTGVTVAVLAGAGLLAASLGQRAREIALTLLEQDRSSQLTAAHLPDVVTLVVMAAGALVAAWYAVTAGVALAALSARGRPRSHLEGLLRRCGAPILRRVLLTTAATGVGVAISLGGAAATVEPDPTLPVDLGWGALDGPSASGPARRPVPSVPSPPPPPPTAPPEDPELGPGTTAPVTPGTSGSLTPGAAGPWSSPAAPSVAPSPASPVAPGGPAGGGVDKSSEAQASAGRTTTRPGASTDRHVVTAGESLWAIAADNLPDSATDAEIAAAWPQWYRANAAVIGADPDLIRPGQLLLAPTKESS